MRDIVIPVLVAVVLTVTAIVVTQNVRFGCVDIGFFKSCGVSVVR